MAVSKYDITLDLKTRAGTSHAFVVDMVGANKRVLDVGCDTGYLGEALTAFGNRMTGYEINSEAAAAARKRYERVEIGDLEAVDLNDVFDEKFDVVIFADVLEHLRDPLPTLRRAKTLLAPGGVVIISVPNVAHGDLRLNLLRGTWQYTEVGLLDDTHTRFFTRESLLAFVHDAGFTMIDFRRTRLPLFGTEVEIRREDFAPDVIATLEADDEATTYQFVVTIAPEDSVSVTSEQAMLVDSLRADLAASQRRHDEQGHDLLRALDRTIGAEASAENYRAQAERLTAELSSIRATLRKVTHERDDARAKSKALVASRSWQVGSAIVAPTAKVRRRLGRGRRARTTKRSG